MAPPSVGLVLFLPVCPSIHSTWRLPFLWHYHLQVHCFCLSVCLSLSACLLFTIEATFCGTTICRYTTVLCVCVCVCVCVCLSISICLSLFVCYSPWRLPSVEPPSAGTLYCYVYRSVCLSVCRLSVCLSSWRLPPVVCLSGPLSVFCLSISPANLCRCPFV